LLSPLPGDILADCLGTLNFMRGQRHEQYPSLAMPGLQYASRQAFRIHSLPDVRRALED
jgi:hypothetical protein